LPTGVYPRKPKNHICYNCNSTTTYIAKDGYALWKQHDEKWYCNNCDNRLFSNPKYKERRIEFTPTGKRILLRDTPRTGTCLMCRATKGIDCKKTTLHHTKYDVTNPLAHTVELCASCHIWLHRNRVTLEAMKTFSSQVVKRLKRHTLYFQPRLYRGSHWPYFLPYATERPDLCALSGILQTNPCL